MLTYWEAMKLCGGIICSSRLGKRAQVPKEGFSMRNGLTGSVEPKKASGRGTWRREAVSRRARGTLSPQVPPHLAHFQFKTGTLVSEGSSDLDSEPQAW